MTTWCCIPGTSSTSARSSTCSASVEPDEIYNLAAMSFVAASWSQPVLTAEFTAHRRHANAGGDARGRARGALLPGVLVRDVREGARGAAEARPLRSTRARPTGSPRLRPLHHRELPRELRPLRRRPGSCSTTKVRAPRARVRDPQGHPRGGRHQARPPGRARARQPRRRARLGLRPATTSRRCG